jgi:5-methyltetrahydropteroyltriglutamate--homocysteine methyltransferase
METRHPSHPDSSFDGGDLDCGSGLLLLIRRHIDPLAAGQTLEILSTDATVEVDLPAWCRMTGNDLLSLEKRDARQISYLVRKGVPAVHSGKPASVKVAPVAEKPVAKAIAQVPALRPLSVMGMGSWPRPSWMLRAVHERMAARMPEAEFQAVADDAVSQAVDAQLRAGVDVLTDGEQRRDSYASFVGGILENCQLIPLTDLLPYVSDPEKFEKELRALDIPAHEVRHPAVFGRIARRQPLALHELQYVRTLSDRPVKIALPGPYLLTRTMWMECLSDRAYASREVLAEDIVAILRAELADLLDAGAALVQFDEPVLSEVVFSRQKAGSGGRSFMCGALGEKKPIAEELAFARDLINAVVAGFPRERTAMHVCRGNWSADESVALSGDYGALLPHFKQLDVGTFMLELATPRAGEIELLRGLPDDRRIGVGVVNQKLETIESVDEVLARAEAAIALFGPERVLLNPDCGFATFADNPLASSRVAEGKLRSIVAASTRLRDKYGV